MKILNPLYDAAFKYLMSDQKVARLLLSTLLEKEVVSLEVAPTEMATQTMPLLTPAKRKKKGTPDDLADKAGLTVYRIDFSASLREPDGTVTQVLIELQKARLVNTLPRFRNYLAEQYKNPNLYQLTKHDGYKIRAGIPIYAIYLLGYVPDLRYANIPVVQVQSHVTDRFSGKTVAKNTPFVRTLFHEGLIVNIPALKEHRRNRVEQMLSIFENAIIPRQYILEITPADYPEEFAPIIRRLQVAAVDSSVKKSMELEDEVLDEWLQWEIMLDEAEREKAEILLEKERAKVEKEQAEKEKEQAEKEREQAEKEREQAEKEREQAEKEKEQAEQEREEMAREKKQAEQGMLLATRLLYQQGLSAEAIAAQLNIPIEMLQKWLELPGEQ